jgi:hypothetical protein
MTKNPFDREIVAGDILQVFTDRVVRLWSQLEVNDSMDVIGHLRKDDVMFAIGPRSESQDLTRQYVPVMSRLGFGWVREGLMRIITNE